MITVKDLREYYKKIDNTELLDILENPIKYQPQAVEVAKQELLKRQLSAEEIYQAKQPLIERELLEERKRKKLELIEDELKKKSNALINTLSPIQQETASIERIMLFIVISFSLIFIFQVTAQYQMLVASVKEFSQFPVISFFTLFPIFILPFALPMFWKKKQIGWILLSVYLTFSSVQAILSLINQYNLLSSLFQTFLFTGTLVVISKQNWRTLFSIDKKKKETTIIITTVITLALLIAGVMN